MDILTGMAIGSLVLFIILLILLFIILLTPRRDREAINPTIASIKNQVGSSPRNSLRSRRKR